MDLRCNNPAFWFWLSLLPGANFTFTKLLLLLKCVITGRKKHLGSAPGCPEATSVHAASLSPQARAAPISTQLSLSGRAQAYHTQCRYGKWKDDKSSQKARSLIQQKRARVHQRPEKRPSLNTRTLSHLYGRQRAAGVSAGFRLLPLWLLPSAWAAGTGAPAHHSDSHAHSPASHR